MTVYAVRLHVLYTYFDPTFNSEISKASNNFGVFLIAGTACANCGNDIRPYNWREFWIPYSTSTTVTFRWKGLETEHFGNRHDWLLHLIFTCFRNIVWSIGWAFFVVLFIFTAVHCAVASKAMKVAQICFQYTGLRYHVFQLLFIIIILVNEWTDSVDGINAWNVRPTSIVHVSIGNDA